MITHYRGSDGRDREIAAMATPHLQNALRKLQRTDPTRQSEIHAMETELAKRPQEGTPA